MPRAAPEVYGGASRRRNTWISRSPGSPRGKVTEPDNDSALFYVNQLRAADPKNGGLTRISAAVQAQILDQARAALDAAQPAKAEALLQLAAGLGASPDLPALSQRLAQAKQALSPVPRRSRRPT